jgi:hypothetical protein
MWYLAAAWNPNPRMCSQVRGVVRNFIWSGKAANARAKVKWETLMLPVTQGGLGIIDPKTQSEALLAKLLVRGLAPRGEPWKEILRHKANQTKLPMHGMGPTTQDINWMFTAPKLKRPPTSLWKSILHSWLSVRPGLHKSEPTNSAEILRQPIFGNPLIKNRDGRSLGYIGKSKGNALANAGRSRIRDLWDPDEEKWKDLTTLGVKTPAVQAHQNGSIRSPTQTTPPPTQRNSNNSQTRDASKQPVHMMSPFPLKGTSWSGYSSRKGTEQHSDWPKISPSREKNLRSIGFSRPDSSPSSSGISGNGTGSKKTTLGTPLSLGTQPRGDIGM